ncbi:MAG: hypothetical protein JHC95_09915 [Solirubrobacteraceae bacterium]|nr:hypothetical protein [Solirubrobacteraceae bacterium]
MNRSQPTPTRRGRALLAATITILGTALLGAPAAFADSVTMRSIDPFPTVGTYGTDFRLTTVAYGDGYVYVYTEAGRASCPASAGAAVTAGMTLVEQASVDGDGVSTSIHPMYRASVEGAYLFCAYIHRGSDTATARGTASMVVNVQEDADAALVTVDASQALTSSNTVTAEVSCPRTCSLSATGIAGSTPRGMDVALGTVTGSIGTFGGSTTMAIPMTAAQRRDLRQRMADGERVRADLTVTATYPIVGWTYTTSASTQLKLLTTGPIPRVVFTGM